MYSITVKNIPDEIYENLKRSARRNRRSINNEIILILERSLQSRKIAPEAFIAQARQIREKTADYMIDDETFEHFKNTGRE
jgi:plasmid stability protein